MPEPRIRLDAAAHRAWLDGQPFRMTRLQFLLLAYLAGREGEAVARAEIMREVWRTDWVGDTKTLDMHVSYLRKKIGVEALATIRGHGYRLEPGIVELTGPPKTEPEPTRVVLVKPGDVLVFGNVGQVTPDQAQLIAEALPDELGLAAVLLFEGDVDITAIPGGSRG